MPPAQSGDLSSGYKQVATAPDGVPVYQNGGQYFTRNADGTYTEQFQGAKPDWLTQATGGGATGAASGGGAPTLNRNDPASVAAYVSYYANQPGANPSLKNDPNYWIGKISSGELGSDPNYIVSKFMLPEGAPAGSGGNQYGQLNAGGFGAAPSAYASNPNAPTYTAPRPTGSLASEYTAPQFTAPTVAEVESRPGYQIGLNTGLSTIQRSAAAKGTVLNPGTVQALNRYGTDYAGTQYANVLSQQANIFGMNAQQQLAGRQQNQTEFQQNVVGPTNTAFQNQYASYLNDNARTLQDYLTNYNIQHTADTDYWGRLKDVSGAGLQAALGDRAA